MGKQMEDGAGRTIIFGAKVVAATLVAWWLGMPGAFRMLLVLQIVDVGVGCLAATQRQELRSALAWSGMARKVIAWLLVLVVYELQVDGASALLPSSPINNMALAAVAAVAFAGAEAISIVENAQRAGLPVPTFLTKSLAQTRDLLFNDDEDSDDDNATG